MIARIPIEVPASGSRTLVEIQGVEIIVEKTPDNTVEGVPLIRLNSKSGEALPAFNQASYRPPEGLFHRLYVEGRGGTAGTLYLSVLTSANAQFRIASTVE